MKNAVTKNKIMYCAIPTRMRDKAEEIRSIVRKMGYAPVIPFDVGPYEDFEGGTVGRERTLDFMMHVQRFCDTCGLFGISEGTLGEINYAQKTGQEIKMFPSYDPEWDVFYDNLNKKYGDPFANLRGPHRLFAMVGPSAVGKTFHIENLLKQFSKKLRRIKNTTTRKPRDNSDKESYQFVSKEDFEKKIKEGQFLEYDNYLGEYYGSSLANIQAVLNTTSGIFAITPSGARALHDHRYEINLSIILLRPESDDMLRKNLLRRGVNDSRRQDELIEKAAEFRLPEDIRHTVVTVTGENDEDEKRILKVLEPHFLS